MVKDNDLNSVVTMSGGIEKHLNQFGLRWDGKNGESI